MIMPEFRFLKGRLSGWAAGRKIGESITGKQAGDGEKPEIPPNGNEFPFGGIDFLPRLCRMEVHNKHA